MWWEICRNCYRIIALWHVPLSPLKLQKIMTKKTRRPVNSTRRCLWWHRWLGIVLTLPLLIFALSGIILNHRHALADADIPRSVLPQAYHYKGWNLGAVKGSILRTADSVLLFGSHGVWLSDSIGQSIAPFSLGLGNAAEHRTIVAMTRTASDVIFAASHLGLYRLDLEGSTWQEERCPMERCPMERGDRIADLYSRGDSLIVMTRSKVYLSLPPYHLFEPIQLSAPDGYEPTVTAFRTIWTLHRGELFGRIGVAVVDLLGVVVIVLSLTGIIILLAPGVLRALRRRASGWFRFIRRGLSSSISLHNRLGVWLLLPLCLLTLTGLFLRPPLLITIVRHRHTPIPLTTQVNTNPWAEKLRTIRYDSRSGDWLLYTSEGFYRLDDLRGTPIRLKGTPPVSFMGVNVLEPIGVSDEWLVGSFSGLFRWNVVRAEVCDAFTNKRVEGQMRTQIPDANHAVAGYCSHLSGTTLVFDYFRGQEVLGEGKLLPNMPADFARARMSLWHLALEAHTGRIFTCLPAMGDILYLFLVGLSLLIVLISGYLVYRRRYRRRR